MCGIYARFPGIQKSEPDLQNLGGGIGEAQHKLPQGSANQTREGWGLRMFLLTVYASKI